MSDDDRADGFFAGLDGAPEFPPERLEEPPLPDVPQPTEPDSPEAAAAKLIVDRERRISSLAEQQAEYQLAKQRGLEQAEQAGADRRRIRLTKASEFKIKAVRWVWQGRMPLGEITLIPGREGVGKSTFLAWQAAALTRGALPGLWFGEKKAVLYAASEDSWEHTIAPRMLAAGADMDLVHKVDVELVEGRFGKLSLPLDIAQLVEVALKVDAGALMCDPVMSVLSDRINTFKAQELRGALEPLRQAAEDAGLAVAGLVHFNKGKDNDVLTAISGSRAWAEVARAVIAIAKDPDAEQYTCVVSQVKNNLGRSDLTHLAYTIASKTLDTEDGGTTEVGAVEWTSQEYAKGVEDILSSAKDKQRPEVQTDVLEFVLSTQQETGALVTTGEVVARWGGKHNPDNIRQALVRLVKDGTLRRAGHGLYGAAENVRTCPECSDPLKPGENFCGKCRRRLDGEARAIDGVGNAPSSTADGLW